MVDVIGSLGDAGKEGRLSTGGFSDIILGRGTFGGGREDGIRSFDVGDIGAGFASAGACRDCVAIAVASLAGGLNLVGAWGILERVAVGEGKDALPTTGSLDGVTAPLVPGVEGITRLFCFAVNRKIAFDRLVTSLACTGLIETNGSTPAADARDVRLPGAGRREIRDVFGVALGYTRETRDPDADAAEVSEIES